MTHAATDPFAATAPEVHAAVRPFTDRNPLDPAVIHARHNTSLGAYHHGSPTASCAHCGTTALPANFQYCGACGTALTTPTS